MTLIDRVLQRSYFGMRREKDAEADGEAVRLPSLASIEYELAQLRISLRGYVDFGNGEAPAAEAEPSVVSSGLSRNVEVQMTLTR